MRMRPARNGQLGASLRAQLSTITTAGEPPPCDAGAGRGEALNPNAEVALTKSVGSTGHRPVPRGYQPLGTTLSHALILASEVKGCLLAIPSGWHVLQVLTSEFGFKSRLGCVSLIPARSNCWTTCPLTPALSPDGGSGSRASPPSTLQRGSPTLNSEEP